MSNEIKFPTSPFYIQSKINLSNWALYAQGDEPKLQAINGSFGQLWVAEPDARGGARLKNVDSGLYLTAQLVKLPPPFFNVSTVAGPLKLQALDTALANQLFRAEQLGDWVGINSLVNWEAKINVYRSDPNGTVGIYHWDGGAENEEWKLLQETSQVTVLSTKYDMQSAKADLSLPPNRNQATVVNNILGGVPQTGSYALQRSVTTTRSITNGVSDMTGQKFTQTFGIKGGIDKVVEVSASASFEESSSKTISFSDQQTDSTTDTDTLTVNVNVPAGRKYSYQVVVYYGKVNVPYTAEMQFQSVVPGSAPKRFTSSGVFTGVNQVRNEIETQDITDGPALMPNVVAKMAVPLNATVVKEELVGAD